MFTRSRKLPSPGLARRSTRPFMVAALCAALLGVAPVTAHAQTFTDRDTVGDVVRFSDSDTDNIVVPAPLRRLNDVTRTRLAHGASRVAVRVDYGELRRGGDVQGLEIHMVTNEGARRYLQLVAYPRHWTGAAKLYTGRWGAVRCNGLRRTIDYGANVMKMSFPRRCASNPRWVKFRAVAYAQAGGGFYADDALSDAPLTSKDDRLTWSGKVRRRARS